MPSTPPRSKAAKPEGEWNRLRIRISPEECSTELNGVPMVRFRLGSDDFKERLAKTKFADMPEFAKIQRGRIALQGDHGVVSFRNIKIRPLASSLSAAAAPRDASVAIEVSAVGPSSASKASRTAASAPSGTVCGPLWPLSPSRCSRDRRCSP